MSWQQALIGLCLGFIVCCLIGAVLGRPKPNRRTGLPAPRPDERSSIEQFKRIHQS
jgi:hypothetical protein